MVREHVTPENERVLRMGLPMDWRIEATTRVSGEEGAVELQLWYLESGKRLLHGRPEGYMRQSELVKVIEVITGDTGFGATLPTLWDFRDHDFERYAPSEFRGHAFIVPQFPARIGVKRGYLVDSSIGYGSLRMFQGAVSGFNFEDQDNLMVSYNLEELVDWLIR